MKTVLLLLSLILFALLALDFSRQDNSLMSPSVSQENLATGNSDEIEESTEETQRAAPTESAPPSYSESTVIISPTPKPSAPSNTATEPEPIPTTVEVASKPAPPSSNADVSIAAQIEADVLRLSNIERTKIGLNELTLDETLASVARAHSKDMIARDFFSHDNPDECSSSCRATAGGYRWKLVGENIHMMSGWKLTPIEAAVMVVQGWMSSPGHRENLLKPGYQESGIGIIVQGDTVYSTGMYGTER